ncbi:hypothetical protein FQZ97_1162070 [compost metagenome]
MQQAGDDFAHRAQFVGQRLVGGVHLGAVAEQGGGQAAVEPLEGNGLDQAGEIGQARGEQAEHEVPKVGVGQRGAERCGRQQRQPGGLDRDPVCAERLVHEQARRGHQAHLARHHAVELQLAPAAGRA